MNYIQMNVTIPAYDNKGLETIQAILPVETDTSVHKVTIVRTSNWRLTKDELAACSIELTRYQMACLIEILYRTLDGVKGIIFRLDDDGNPELEIYDDYRE